MDEVTVDKTPVSNVETPQNFDNKQVELTVNGDNRAASSDFAYTMEGLADCSKGSVVSNTIRPVRRAHTGAQVGRLGVQQHLGL